MAANPPADSMMEYFGIRIVSAEKEKVTAEVDTDHRHLNGHQIMHGGALMAFADGLGGMGAALNVAPGTRTTTLESKTNFFRPCTRGRVTGVSVPIHLGRRTMIWRTSVYGGDGKLAAEVTQTQLVIPRD